MPLLLFWQTILVSVYFGTPIFFSATNKSCRRYSREETAFRPPKKVGLRQLLGVVKSFPNNTNLSEKSGLHLLWDGGSRLQNLFWDEGLTLDQL
jgi:hypothetical protein